MWSHLQPAPPTVAVLALALCAAAGGPTPAVAGERQPAAEAGLIELPRPFLADQGVLQLGAASAEILPPRRWRLRASWSLSNTWAHSRAVQPFLSGRGERAPVTLDELRALRPVDDSGGIFYLDGESRRFELAARRGLADGIEVGVTLPLVDDGGGLADPIVEGFHRWTGHDNNGREAVPRGDYTLYLRSDGRLERYADRSPSLGLGDLRLEARVRLPAVRRWKLAVRGLVELPTGDPDPLYGSGDVDLGLQLLAGHDVGHGRIHLGAGAVWSRGHDALRAPSQFLFSGLVAYRHPLGRRAAVFVQLTAADAPLEHLRLVELGRENYLLDVGLELPLGSGPTLVLAASENNFTFQSSADFALHVGLIEGF